MTSALRGTKAEDAILGAESLGYVRIDRDGSVWITMARGGRRAPRPCTPRRTDRIGTGGYSIVCITIDGVRCIVPAHRLVYRKFRGPIPDGLTINHLNGKRSDNRIENLEHATSGSFQAGEVHPNAKLSDSQVEEIRAQRESGATLAAIGERFGVSFKTISKIVRGERRTRSVA